MKVSEAMRLADEMELPDLRGLAIDSTLANWVGEKPPCCAIGGASVASRSFEFVAKEGHLTWDSVHTANEPSRCDDFRHFFYGFGMMNCPACGLTEQASLAGMTVHLYDGHEWSRTQIADWLDSLDVSHD